jgi:hypothetical protein
LPRTGHHRERPRRQSGLRIRSRSPALERASRAQTPLRAGLFALASLGHQARQARRRMQMDQARTLIRRDGDRPAITSFGFVPLPSRHQQSIRAQPPQIRVGPALMRVLIEQLRCPGRNARRIAHASAAHATGRRGGIRAATQRRCTARAVSSGTVNPTVRPGNPAALR